MGIYELFHGILFFSVVGSLQDGENGMDRRRGGGKSSEITILKEKREKIINVYGIESHYRPACQIMASIVQWCQSVVHRLSIIN